VKKLVIILVFTVTHNFGFAAESCSRIAIINYQEVLVDTNSTQRGEGLRYHLEKDNIAKSYLDKYQEGSQIKWQNSLLGSVGTGLVLSSFLTNSNGSSKKSLLIGGAALIAINFLVAKTLDSANEKNFVNAIDEYNKRNLPKIYFSPKGREGRNPSGYEVGLGKSWSY
jgi:ABC-type multidrug transport system ATPase subunit